MRNRLLTSTAEVDDIDQVLVIKGTLYKKLKEWGHTNIDGVDFFICYIKSVATH
jgi:hypothetical protein